jgi:hypothetical protein
MDVKDVLEIEGIHLLKETPMDLLSSFSGDDDYDDDESLIVEKPSATGLTWESLVAPWLACSPRVPEDGSDVFSADGDVYDSNPIYVTTRDKPYKARLAGRGKEYRSREAITERARHRKHLSRTTMALITGEVYHGSDIDEEEEEEEEEEEGADLERVGPSPACHLLGSSARFSNGQNKHDSRVEEIFAAVESKKQDEKPDLPKQILIVTSSGTRSDSTDSTRSSDRENDSARISYSQKSSWTGTHDSYYTGTTNDNSTLEESWTQRREVAKLRKRMAQNAKLRSEANRLYSYLQEIKDDNESYSR